MELPEDTRWYVRFPHAATNDAGLERLPQERRKDWHFFYTREAPGEADAERARMTAPSPLPQLYRPFNRPVKGAWGRILDEAGETHLRTLAIWSYIYE